MPQISGKAQLGHQYDRKWLPKLDPEPPTRPKCGRPYWNRKQVRPVLKSISEYLILQSSGDLFPRQLSRALAAFAALGTEEEDAPILEVIEHLPSVLEPHALFVGNLTGEEECRLLRTARARTVDQERDDLTRLGPRALIWGHPEAGVDLR